MKFEDLKLPEQDPGFGCCLRTARAVYKQMREHYEAKLAEVKPEPEELFEHPDMPGKKFRRLKVGETIEETDMFSCEGIGEMEQTAYPGARVDDWGSRDYYREVPQPAPAWRLPDPPPGQQWHRDDWTQDMLPEGYRPLLLGEPWVEGDEIMRYPAAWHVAGGSRLDTLGVPAIKQVAHLRTRRPLPAPVEYMPLEPGDVPPGSAVRPIGEQGWRLVTRVEEDCFGTSAGTFDWCDLADRCEILRPNSTTWEPCKKPKA